MSTTSAARITRVGRWTYSVEPRVKTDEGRWTTPFQGYRYLGRWRAEWAAERLVRKLDARRQYRTDSFLVEGQPFDAHGDPIPTP